MAAGPQTPRTKVVMPNCKAHICKPSGEIYKPSVTGNVQREIRKREELLPALQGRGRSEADLPFLYRIRIDVFEDGTAPQAGDKVFVANCTTNKNMNGWYEMWDEPYQTTGANPTQLLYVKKQINSYQ